MSADKDAGQHNPEVESEFEERGHGGAEHADDSPQNPKEPGGSGWSSTTQAARALGVSSRTIRRYVEAGDLVARRKPGQGSQSTLEIDIDSLQQLRMRRLAEGYAPTAVGDKGGDAKVETETSGVDYGDTLADIIERLSRSYADARAEAASAQARLELTERAESSLREEVAKERGRAEEAERRSGELERELAEARRPKGWWARMFGGAGRSD